MIVLQRRSLLSLVACLFPLTILPTLLAQTQSADYSGVTIPVGAQFSGPQGVAVDTHGNVFVADTNDNQVKEILAGTGGAAPGQVNASSTVNVIQSGFNSPYGIAIDGSGDLFVADTGNSAVKEIVATSGSVSSSSTVNIVGSGFNFPYAVAVDASGDVFVADTGNSAVKEIVAVSGAVSSTSTVNTIGSGFS